MSDKTIKYEQRHEHTRAKSNFSSKATIKIENDEILLHTRKEAKRQQAGSGKAAGRQEAAGRAGKRAKAILSYKQKSDT